MSSRSVALLIASSEFGGQPELRDLKCPPEDVRGLAEVLRDPRCGGFDRVDELINEDDRRVAFRLNEVLLEATSRDFVLVYYSGHGKLNRSGHLHLAMPNTVHTNVETTSLPIFAVRNYLDNCNARRIVLILDCCFSGRVGDVFLKASIGDNLQATFEQSSRGVYILTASTGIESAVEKDGERYSVFTGPLIEGLATGKADVDRSGWVDMDELYKYVLSEANKAGTQTPMRFNLSSVDGIRIARNPHHEDEPLPADRWTALIELGREEVVPRTVLVDAFAFLEGRSQPFDVERAGDLIDRLAEGDIEPSSFADAWSVIAEQDQDAASRPLTVLSIDGGGIRTLLPALALANIEQRTGRRVNEMFDVIAGTGFGALLALALSMPGDNDGLPSTAAQCVTYLEELGPKVFDRSLFQRIRSADGLLGDRFDVAPLAKELDDKFGQSRLSDLPSHLAVSVTAYDVNRQAPFFFRTRRAQEDPAYDFLLRDVARAATALPTLFAPTVVLEGVDSTESYALIDGSVFAFSPAMAAYAEARRIRPEAPEPLVVSLGTGEQTRKMETQDWGLMAWARPLFDIAGQGSSAQVDYQLRQLLGTKRYYRIQAALTLASDDLSDATEDNLQRLRRQGEEMLEASQAMLDSLCRTLARHEPVLAS